MPKALLNRGPYYIGQLACNQKGPFVGIMKIDGGTKETK
jgi:hypothetical protein